MSLNLYGFLIFVFISLSILSAVIENNVGIASTTLTAQMSRTDTTMSVHRTQGFKPTGSLRIDQEVVCYTGVTATTFTGLTRACKGSSTPKDGHSLLDKNGANRQVFTRQGGIIDDLTKFNENIAFSEGGFTGFFKGLFGSVAAVVGLVPALARMAIWDYSYLEGPYVYVKYILFYPLSGMLMLGMVKLALGR
jgi:hypothetical protein